MQTFLDDLESSSQGTEEAQEVTNEFLKTYEDLEELLQSEEMLNTKLEKANSYLTKIPMEINQVYQKLHNLVEPIFKDLDQIVPN